MKPAHKQLAVPRQARKAVEAEPEKLYLDLMKKALSFSLWPEPPVPIKTFNDGRPAGKRLLVSLAARVFKALGLQIVRDRTDARLARDQGRIIPWYADTMIGLERLDNLQYCIETAIAEGIEGDLIETGVWRGGACIFMRAVLAAYGVEDRRIFVADSFEGLPPPDAAKYPADKGDRFHTNASLAVAQEQVENNFRRYGLLDDQVVFLKGWFKDTLPDAPIQKLAVLRLDGDMYGSTIEVLRHLYPKLSEGGFCIIDDYALPGCRKAVDDYRKQHGVETSMTEIDWTGVYWRKP